MSGQVVVPFDQPSAWSREAGRVAEHLRAGGLMAYPTETVYGLGCALRAEALARLARLKGREAEKPFLLLVDIDAIPEGLIWTDAARALARRFWPGPLTLVLAAEPGRFPPGVEGPDGGVAVRATPHQGVRALLRALGEPITSTSANEPGSAPAADAAQALEALRSLAAPADLWLLDGGRLAPSPPSTILDCTGARPRLLRAGAVASDLLTDWVVPNG